MNDPEPDTWLRQAGSGDRAAFDAFVGATAPAVWAMLRRLTQDEATAEDVMQETYSAAWHAASSYRGEGSAQAWLFGLARNHAARSWRRRAGEPRQNESLTEPLEGLASQAGWGAQPEALVARAEDRELLLKALHTLSPQDQEVIARCDLEDRAPVEVADELGVASGTLRVRLHRARLRLLGALKEVGDE